MSKQGREPNSSSNLSNSALWVPEGFPMISTKVNPSAAISPEPARFENVCLTPSTAELWIGRVITGLTVLFLLFDAVGKFLLPQQVVNAPIRLGLPVHLNLDLAVILTVISVLYLMPATAVLGAVLVTAYLGGAVAIQWRAGMPALDIAFPVLFGVIVWAGILLRDVHLRQIFPLRLRRRQ